MKRVVKIACVVLALLATVLTQVTFITPFEATEPLAAAMAWILSSCAAGFVIGGIR